MLPELLQHYEVTVSETKVHVQVKTKGGISKKDQEKLVKLGWIKKSDNTFVQLKPIFEEIEVDDD